MRLPAFRGHAVDRARPHRRRPGLLEGFESVSGATLAQLSLRRGDSMAVIVVAWMLGVPFSIIVLWYVVGHAACG
jgi:hypothetical protein